MLRNPLASPDIIGISYGASATAVAAVVIFGVRGAGVSVAAIIGALLVALLITALARGRGGTGLILIGIGAAAFMQAAVTFLLSRADITQRPGHHGLADGIPELGQLGTGRHPGRCAAAAAAVCCRRIA